MILMLFGANEGIGQCDCDNSNIPKVGSAVGVTNLADAISQGLLLPMPQASLTPQTVCVQGGFLINDPQTPAYEFVASHLTLDANAVISVVSGSHLTIRNSDIKGCDYMWGEISVAANAQLDMGAK